MEGLILHIVSPEGTLVNNVPVSAVFLPGEQGPFEVLIGHAALISPLIAGEIRYVTEAEGEQSLRIRSGFAEIRSNLVSLAVEPAE